MLYYTPAKTKQAPAQYGYYPFQAGELLTAKELKQIGIAAPGSFFQAVNVSRKKIYFCFGKRFAR